MASQRAWLERQRGELVSDVAHELRNPLANIRNLLEAAQDGVVELDPDLVSSLLEEALLLQHVIDDLRDLSAAKAGELRLHPEPVDLSDSLGQVVAMHQTSAERPGTDR
ncbi:sensor histidine kinase [Amycolatopsis sp. lyj-108]|uniref:sensor histidine kinase n=1 Tax=Amycolatopsis sp. lyj-108 TaxID=2789286 RepID=UPI00397C8DE0